MCWRAGPEGHKEMGRKVLEKVQWDHLGNTLLGENLFQQCLENKN